MSRVSLRFGTDLTGRVPWRFAAALALHVGAEFALAHPALHGRACWADELRAEESLQPGIFKRGQAAWGRLLPGLASTATG